jgi:hypothetical protein
MRRSGRNLFPDVAAEVAFEFNPDQVLLSLSCCRECEMMMGILQCFFVAVLIICLCVSYLSLCKSIVIGVV